MSQTEIYPTHHHHFQTLAVMTLAGSAVLGAGYMVTGGVRAVERRIENAKNTSFGLKNITISDTKSVSDTIALGTATSACLSNDAYSVDRVYTVGKNQDAYRVYVRQIGKGSLDAAGVEACVLESTGQDAEIVVTAK